MTGALVVAVALASPARALPSLATTAEATARTGRDEAVVRPCRDDARAYPRVACDSDGVSVDRLDRAP